MQGWHTTFLGMRGLPRDISDFEMKAFFTFDGAERDAINARRGDSHKLGLALHIGFLRMSGRLLGAFRVIPVALWRHLGNELGIAAPEVASLRAMYERGRTLFDHQQVACTVLGFQWMSEHQRRSLVRELRDEVARCADRDQLLVRARQWLYKNKLVIVHERAIRTLIAAALAQLEVETGTAIAASVDPATLDRWRASVSELRPDGQTQQSWLWAAPAKHSTRQISEVLERIDLLYTLDVHKHLADIPDLIHGVILFLMRIVALLPPGKHCAGGAVRGSRFPRPCGDGSLDGAKAHHVLTALPNTPVSGRGRGISMLVRAQ
jgi:hypothetical protein